MGIYAIIKIGNCNLVDRNFLRNILINKYIRGQFAGIPKFIEKRARIILLYGPKLYAPGIEGSSQIVDLRLFLTMFYHIGIYKDYRRHLRGIVKMLTINKIDITFLEKGISIHLPYTSIESDTTARQQKNSNYK